MPTSRRYDDPCGVARALNVLGDRWTLLIVRELIYGPKRFSQLRAGLPGVSPNVLSERLRDLESAGLLGRNLVDPPTSITLYELTSRGYSLRPILLELGRWGSAQPMESTQELSPHALFLALETLFVPATAIDATYAIGLDGDWFRITVTDRSLDIIHSRTEAPTTILQTDVASLRAVALGRESVSDAERHGRLSISGDRGAAARFSQLFSAPVRTQTR